MGSPENPGKGKLGESWGDFEDPEGYLGAGSQNFRGVPKPPDAFPNIHVGAKFTPNPQEGYQTSIGLPVGHQALGEGRIRTGGSPSPRRIQEEAQEGSPEKRAKSAVICITPPTVLTRPTNTAFSFA